MRLLQSLFALVAMMPALAAAAPATPITFQLYWKHQFQFAGYYAAIERGFYRDAGFDVKLQEPQEGIDPIDVVLSGGAEYGVGASELALRRGRGQPVVAMATILQHSPLVLIALGSGTSLQELVGKKVMMMPHETELIAYLQFEGLPLDRINVIPHTYDVKDLLSRKVDAMSGYSTDEIYRLKQSGKPYSVFSPRSSGIDFYGDTLFTTSKRVAEHADQVAAFRDASLKGWQYAMDHPGEIADVIIARYSQRKTRDELLFEAGEMRRLMQPQLIEIGHMNPGRWQHIAETYAQRGMLPPGYSLDGFLLGSWAHGNWRPSNAVVAIGIAMLLTICVAIGLLWRGNRRLSHEVVERRHAQAGLRISEQRFRALIECAPLAMVTWDTHQCITGWNRQAEGLFGWGEEEVMGRDFMTFLVPDSASAQVGIVVKDALERGTESHSVNSNLTKDRRTIEVEWHNTVVPGIDGLPDSVLSVAQDVTERVRAEAALQDVNLKLRQRLDDIHELQTQLRDQVMRDSLTGMYNRRYLDDALPGEISRAIRERVPLCLMMVDIDHFKRVNDTYGHPVGDEVLRRLAEILRIDARRSDVACRYGGEEFVLLLPKMNLETARMRAERWRQIFAEMDVAAETGTFRCTLSVGIALFPEHGGSAEELLRNGDRALYMAKELGRNRVEVYASGPASDGPAKN